MISYVDKVNELSVSKTINDLMGASTWCLTNKCVGKFNNRPLKILTFQMFINEGP